MNLSRASSVFVFGFILSPIVASLSYWALFSLTVGYWPGTSDPGEWLASAFIAILLLALAVAIVCSIPLFLFFTYVEKRGINQAWVYVLFGAALGLMGSIAVIGLWSDRDYESFLPAAFFAIFTVPAGVISASYYWYFVGRDARRQD